MQKRPRTYFYTFVLLALTVLLCGFGFKLLNTYQKSVPLGNEKELKVTLDAGVGNLSLSHAKRGVLFDTDTEADLKYDLSHYIDYSLRDRVGYLSINTSEELEKRSDDHGKSHSIHFSGFDSNQWNMHFTDAVPISFDIELGFGKGNLDFTGLSVKDLNLSCGASSVVVRFDQPNKSIIEDLSIETGLSKFTGSGLCNANFNHLRFQGGVGGYSLDFSGKLEREVDVDIEVGVGSLRVFIPEDIGAKIEYEKNFISHIDLARDFSEREENNYTSTNYGDARGKINLRIKAGVGSVKIRRE